MQDPATMSQNPQQDSLSSSDGERAYRLKISPLVVDKLGVKLYDKASAVVSELIANSYDADAETVEVRLPLGTALATVKDGELDEKGYHIEVVDDGHGMTPREAQRFYLEIGRNRRSDPEQGSRSREKERPVMGRKGIGKLAPFGICSRIEVLSAGGPKTSRGYLVSHFYLDYKEITSMDSDERDVPLRRGASDRTYKTESGTIVRLSAFQRKRVPDAETFYRQLAARFGYAWPDFEIWVEDLRAPDVNPPRKISVLDVPLAEETRIDLSQRPVFTEDGERLEVQGWIGMAKEHYKYPELVGVRIYARGKIVATTRDFEQPAGYTGEFTLKSYLVGEVHADWLDLDEGEDLIRSDRQGILWESEYGRALRKWGAQLVKEVGRLSAKPRRKKTSAAFLERSDFLKRAQDKYSHQEIVTAAVDLAKQIGAFANEEELEDQHYVDELADVILAVAPHRALIYAFKEFAKQVEAGDVSMDNLMDLFGKTRVAETASYGQIAAERVKSIRELERIVQSTSVNEAEFQKLLARSPWLIEPTWTVITANQWVRTFKSGFEAFYRQRTGEEVVLDIGLEYERKRPDFTLVSSGHRLYFVEIKTSGHDFNDDDFSRLKNYRHFLQTFWDRNPSFQEEFSNGWQIELVADGVDLKEDDYIYMYEQFLKDGVLERISWHDFLNRAKEAHQTFLDINAEFEQRRSEFEGE